MEHLNWRLKIIIASLGSNTLPTSVQRMAKSLSVIHEACMNFKKESDVNYNKEHHTYPSFTRDFDIILNELLNADVFSTQQDRNNIVYNKKPLLQI